MPTNLPRLAVALLLAACAACSPDGLYAVNYQSLSAGVMFEACIAKYGYYNSANGLNDSGEINLCHPIDGRGILELSREFVGAFCFTYKQPLLCESATIP